MARKEKTKKRNWLKRTSINILKYVVLPIITGVFVWAITKHFGEKKINDLDKNIISLESVILSLKNKIQVQQDSIQVQQDSLFNNTKYIENLEIKLQNCTNSGVFINGGVTGGIITGTQHN